MGGREQRKRVLWRSPKANTYESTFVEPKAIFIAETLALIH